MGAAIVGAFITGGLSYAGASKQARAIEKANQANVQFQREKLQEYKDRIGPAVDSAKAKFESGAADLYTDRLKEVADYADTIGKVYGDRAAENYAAGTEAEKFAYEENLRRAGITPEQYAKEQVGIADTFFNPYRSNVIDSGVRRI